MTPARAPAPRPARGTWIRIALIPLIMGGVMFSAAGRLDWLAAWLYIALAVLVQMSVMLTLQRTSPDLLEERRRMGAGTKAWDKAIAPLIALVLPAGMWLAAGLEQRYGAARFDLLLQCAGFLTAAASALLTAWAMTVNRFFSGTVRIQSERGHRVISTGPYAFVRHPGCVGMIGFTLATPLALGSRWAFVPSVICVVLLIVRTALEDATLRAELEGYAEYAARVRSRLLPGLW